MGKEHSCGWDGKDSSSKSKNFPPGFSKRPKRSNQYKFKEKDGLNDGEDFIILSSPKGKSSQAPAEASSPAAS